MPHPTTVNGDKSPCPTSFLLRKFGHPRANYGTDCRPPSATFWKTRIATENVGPFKVTGHRKAVAQLKLALTDLKSEKPHVYAALGTAGMLCCRYVRGSNSVISNHSLGLAIDFTLNGILDPRGDDKVQVGLLDLYSVMKRHGFYWGVEFGTEDAMHFEICSEMVMDWVRKGEF
jgi:hypothetical protein